MLDGRGGLPLHVSVLEWAVALGVTMAVLLFDVVVIARRPREPTMRECAIALSAYVGFAVLFGIWVWWFHGPQFGLEFLAGWLTEYSLSVDNLFIFIFIMASFNVPKRYQQQALFVGIVIALLFRAVFIALGAIAIQKFGWVFYVFGAFLVYAGVRLARGAGSGGDADNVVVRFARRRLNTADGMVLVIVALGATDLMFALDSIPAIYGLTREPYLVLAANVFALMGLRQLYFLLGGLLERLVYLGRGLAVILGFIGVKLIFHALRENSVPFINGGEHVDVPEIPTLLSLAVIVVTLGITAAASLYRTRAVARARTG